jgi:Ca2+-binding EF-hand superfamily protein
MRLTRSSDHFESFNFSKQVRLLQEAELRKVFNKVDRDRRGALTKDEFELLLMAIGHNLTLHELDACFKDMGVEAGGVVPFELFVEWWTDAMGMEAIRKKHATRK